MSPLRELKSRRLIIPSTGEHTLDMLPHITGGNVK
jgi:hypothetical protein